MLASTLLCLVVGVFDGDTLAARCGQPSAYGQMTIRIAAIDAPEKNQAFGRASRQALADLCHGQQATIRLTDIDRYNRTVADVRCQGQDAGQYMVGAGMAWVYDRYAKGHSDLYFFQENAQAARRGLWQDAHPVPPWQWGNRKRPPRWPNNKH